MSFFGLKIFLKDIFVVFLKCSVIRMWRIIDDNDNNDNNNGIEMRK